MIPIRQYFRLSVFVMLIMGSNAALLIPVDVFAAHKPVFDQVYESENTSDNVVPGSLHAEWPLDRIGSSPFHVHGNSDKAHYCGTDFTSEKSRLALEKYTTDKALGRYSSVPKGDYTPSVVGDERSFNVSENNTWMPLEFRLVEVTSLYNLWVEIAELDNGNVSTSDISNLRERALNSSPSRSIDPTKGFFGNNHTVYGLPPNVDGDGLVDLLMYDIGRGTGTTLGYVSPQDLVIGGGTSEGNQRDVLYLDSNEGTSNISTLAAVAAHEYTHLIHLTYGWDETFISEGYAEYAIDFNGYYWRATTYTLFPDEVSLPLFTWRASGGTGARDYERAALFTTYLGNRVGTLAVGEMLRGQNKKGPKGIDSVLTNYGENLADVILDFHTANFFNDQSIDPKFGFIQPERAAHHVPLTSAPINGEVMTTVGEGGYADNFFELIQAGSVRYRRYNSVSNMVVKYDVPIDPIFGEATQIFARSRNSGRVAFQRVGSSTIEFADLPPSDTFVSLSGRFDWVLFLFVQNNPAGIGDRTRFEATWIPLSKATDTEIGDELPTEIELGVNFPNPFNPQTSIPLKLPTAQHVRLEVFDMLGKRMTLLFDGMLPAGNHSFVVTSDTWPSGSYLVRLTSAGEARSQIMTLLK